MAVTADRPLRDFEVDHLILLVGANPLPNAVAGVLLATPGATVTLVHSSDGLELAGRLAVRLKAAGAASVPLMQIEESNPGSVYKAVQQQLNNVPSARVGLNYTAGTKVMSVHAHRAVEHWAAANHREVVFSYLDARTLRMRIDPADPADVRGGSARYVGRGVRIKLADLVGLHGWSFGTSTPATESILPNSANMLRAIQIDPQAAADWDTWLKTELFPKAKQTPVPDGKWLRQTDLKLITLIWPAAPSLQGLTNTMREELGQSVATSLSLEAAAKRCGYKKTEDFCKWLNGLWLESVVLGVLKDCAEKLHLDDPGMNLKPSNVADFEFDVAAMRGYQLFAFSCSTDSKKGLLKSKLFEAYIRARQLGGDEARVALVCCADWDESKQQPMVKSLEDEMRREIDPEGRIRVFGRANLATLAADFTDWIQRQSKES